VKTRDDPMVVLLKKTNEQSLIAFIRSTPIRLYIDVHDKNAKRGSLI
jgi:hypothetical protein